MTIKNYLLFLVVGLLSASMLNAQPMPDKTGDYPYDTKYPTDYELYDSIFIKKKKKDQHEDFFNKKYPYPARPKDMWEIGLEGGYLLVSGDIPVQPGWGFGGHIRKSFGYLFSLQGSFMAGTAYGEQYKSTNGLDNNWVFNGSDVGVNIGAFTAEERDQLDYENLLGYNYHNYETKIRHLIIEGVLTLNNLKFHKRRTKWDLWGFAGGGGMLYSSYYDQLDASGNNYVELYRDVYENSQIQQYNNGIGGAEEDEIGTRKDILSWLRDGSPGGFAGRDGEYETPSEAHLDEEFRWLGSGRDGEGARRYTYQPVATTGVGLAYKLGRRVSLAYVHKVAFTNDDLVDGQRWQEDQNGNALTRNFDTYHFGALNLNLHLGGKKSVEPLWWLNPLEYAYDELATPVDIPDFELPDSDGDGVPDLFDREPNTPEGCPVDNWGVILDTDGDGVPDCKDKELITPTECQPSDADGIGNCPDPTCDCPTPVYTAPAPTPVYVDPCAGMYTPSVGFSSKSYCVGSQYHSSLDQLAQSMRDNGCSVVVSGYADDHSNPKCNEKLAWLRSKAVIDYMTSKYGLPRERFIQTYSGYSGAGSTVSMSVSKSGYGGGVQADPHPSLNCGRGCN